MAEVIACCEHTVAIRMVLPGPIAMVNFCTIKALSPDSLGSPGDRACGSFPFYVSQLQFSAWHLLACSNIVEEELIFIIVCTKVLGVQRPV